MVLLTRGNLVSSQKALHSLTSVSGTLKTLVLSENPLAEAQDYRLHLLGRLPLLERLDKTPVTADEREEALAVLRVRHSFVGGGVGVSFL